MASWQPSTLVGNRQQQLAELIRNKGIVCRDFLLANACEHGANCPYMHITDGEERPLPETTCLFYVQSVCLREKCKFFHGPRAELDRLRAAGKTTYRPQDYMKCVSPPSSFSQPIGADMSISSANSSIAQPVAMPLLFATHQPTAFAQHQPAAFAQHQAFAPQPQPQQVMMSTLIVPDGMNPSHFAPKPTNAAQTFQTIQMPYGNAHPMTVVLPQSSFAPTTQWVMAMPPTIIPASTPQYLPVLRH